MSDNPEFIYSGVVKDDDVTSPDFLWIRIQRSIGDRVVIIQSTSADRVKFELRLTAQQANGLYLCLHNALQHLSREPSP